MNTTNDFCTSPLPSWIGNVRNPDGKILAQGCSKCHAGLGARPSAELSRAQLENIDCLICHARGYRRDLYADENGNWEWRPILWKNQVGLDSVSKRIVPPERGMCLRCHSGAGGGPNWKRGDIEYALAECDREFDVHMGGNGADLQCIACHTAQDHRNPRARRRPRRHGPAPASARAAPRRTAMARRPHGVQVLDHHARKVDCTVCHIPEFAKSDSTDMRRDWSRPVHKAEGKQVHRGHHPRGERAPGLRLVRRPDPPCRRWASRSAADEDGRVGIMIPQGRRKDRDAKLHAFKLHRGVLPVAEGRGLARPHRRGRVLRRRRHREGRARGRGRRLRDPRSAIRVGGRTIRFMGIFHEVQPAERALGCPRLPQRRRAPRLARPRLQAGSTAQTPELTAPGSGAGCSAKRERQSFSS